LTYAEKHKSALLFYPTIYEVLCGSGQAIQPVLLIGYRGGDAYSGTGLSSRFYVASTTDGRIIRALNVNADGFMSNQQHAKLRTFDLLVSWELGNSLALFAGYEAKSLDQEIGDHVPDRW
jgi:hypothetical protein